MQELSQPCGSKFLFKLQKVVRFPNFRVRISTKIVTLNSRKGLIFWILQSSWVIKTTVRWSKGQYTPSKTNPIRETFQLPHKNSIQYLAMLSWVLYPSNYFSKNRIVTNCGMNCQIFVENISQFDSLFLSISELINCNHNNFYKFLIPYYFGMLFAHRSYNLKLFKFSSR